MVTQAKHPTRRVRRDERGQALAMAAVSIVAVLAVGALAVDLGMAFAARAAAQRAADSAALAGASAFVDYSFSTNEAAAVQAAEERARQYALNNDVLARPIEPSQVTVWVIPDSQKVRVRISATDLPTWFARVLGVYSMDVAAMAAAVASDAGRTDQCVLPFAIGDLWDSPVDDLNENRIPDNGELWNFDPSKGDRYAVFNDTATVGCSGFGLGSCWRDDEPRTNGISSGIEADVGRRIWIKAGPPNPKRDPEAGGLDIMVGPGNFYIWEMPDPEMECQGRPGANWVSANISGCNACGVNLFEDYETQTGNIASIEKAITDLINEDLYASWDSINHKLVPSEDYPGETSPRVRIVPLWDPNQELQGKTTVQFNNFAKIFIEGGGTAQGGGDFAIYARFMGTITGESAGPNTGSLVKYLRLVE